MHTPQLWYLNSPCDFHTRMYSKEADKYFKSGWGGRVEGIIYQHILNNFLLNQNKRDKYLFMCKDPIKASFGIRTHTRCSIQYIPHTITCNYVKLMLILQAPEYCQYSIFIDKNNFVTIILSCVYIPLKGAGLTGPGGYYQM